MDLLDNRQSLIVRMILAVLVLLAAWVVAYALRRGIERYIRRRNLRESDPAAATKFRMVERLVSAALLFVGLGFGFYMLDIAALRRLAVGMFASAGIVGIAVGFAAQATIANLVSGVMIAFVQPLRLGDRVSVAGEFGVVEEIGLFYTHIRSWDNRRILIPNKVLSNEVVRNYTVHDPSTPAVLVFRIEHGADFSRAEEILREQASASPLALDDPCPTAYPVDSDDKGVGLRLVVWAAWQEDAWKLAVELSERCLERLASEGIAALSHRVETPDPSTWADLPRQGPEL